MNRIFHVEAFVWEYNQIPSRYGNVNFFQTGKDIDDMKSRLERDNWLIDFKYKKIKEVANNENLIGYIKEFN